MDDDYDEYVQDGEEYNDDEDDGGGEYDEEEGFVEAELLPKRLRQDQSLDEDLIPAVDLTMQLSPLDTQALVKRGMGLETQHLLELCLVAFQQVKSTPNFMLHFKALGLLIKVVDKHQNETNGMVLEKCLKRALYQSAQLCRHSEQDTLDLSALIRDKCVKKVDDAKYLLTMLSLRIDAVSGLKMLVKTFPKSPVGKSAGRVASNYYRGREALLLNQPKDALKWFDLAFHEIPNHFLDGKPRPQTLRNKKRIFSRILPLRLVCEGKIPLVHLLQQFKLEQVWEQVYYPLVVYAQQGNEIAVLKHVDVHRTFLLRNDCLTIVQSTMQAVARQHVFRIAFQVLGKQMDLHLLAKLDCFGGDLDQLTFVLADLFSRGLLKGYMTLMSVVLPKGDRPFPSLYTAQERHYRKGLV
ncbi:hypothetical protein BASA81_002095 [Batrachochytrium salamandrivorans]|nr:hypothetical protein BASA81_002095 [Batrachochytrium salamandrivorans]